MHQKSLRVNGFLGLESPATMRLLRHSLWDDEFGAEFLVAIFHRLEDFGVLRVIVNADHFLGIFDEVEKLPFFGAGEVKEFVLICAYAVVGGDVVGGFSGVEVVDGIAPVIGGFAFVFQDGNQAFALDVFGDFDASGFEEGGCVIDVLDECLWADAGFYNTWPAHDERHAQ